ncbi:uncharacterized protein [Antedon mediterranea]|uniref:uncharacterized protein n=1 Tax=Antedon mediterranea TaxID=105859 RepID=UPI003AF9DCDE
MAAANTRILFEEFNVQDGDIDTYVDRLEQYFVALDINDGGKKRAILLSSLGETGYTTIRDLCFPDKPSTKSYDTPTTKLKEHYKPTRITISERFIFRNVKQTPGQTISQFVSHLKKKAIHCGFEGEALENALRDQFVCGLISQSIQKKLLTKNHTFKEATDIAIASEAATANMKSMSHDVDKPINHVTSNSRKSTKTYQASKLTRTQKCDRCGMNNHTRDTCKYKNATCFKCNKQGHLKSECRRAVE